GWGQRSARARAAAANRAWRRRAWAPATAISPRAPSRWLPSSRPGWPCPWRARPSSAAAPCGPGPCSAPPSGRRPSWPAPASSSLRRACPWRARLGAARVWPPAARARPWRRASSMSSWRLASSRNLLATALRASHARRIARAGLVSGAADCSHAVRAIETPFRVPFRSSDEALLEALFQDVSRQVDADEDHLAALLLARRPLRSEVGAHQLVHALEDDLAVGALHVQHALVAQHLRPVDLDDRAEEVLELAGVERLVGAEDERLDVVVVGMVVRMVAVLAVVVVVVVVVVLVGLQEVGVDVELGVEVEALEVEDVLERHLAEVDLGLRRARIHVLDAVDQRRDRLVVDEVGLADEDLVGEADLAARFLAAVELLVAVLGVDQRQDRVEQVGLGDLVVHEERLRDRAGVGQAGRLDDDALEVELALPLFLGQVGERRPEVLADRAADAAVVELDDLFLGVLDQDLVVDVLLAELVLDDGDLLAVRLGEHTLQERRFARAEEAGQDGRGN